MKRISKKIKINTAVVNEDSLVEKLEIEESNENHTQNPSSNESTTPKTYEDNNLTLEEVVSNSNNTDRKINYDDNILSEHLPQRKDHSDLIKNLLSNVLTERKKSKDASNVEGSNSSSSSISGGVLSSNKSDPTDSSDEEDDMYEKPAHVKKNIQDITPDEWINKFAIKDEEPGVYILFTMKIAKVGIHDRKTYMWYHDMQSVMNDKDFTYLQYGRLNRSRPGVGIFHDCKNKVETFQRWIKLGKNRYADVEAYPYYLTLGEENHENQYPLINECAIDSHYWYYDLPNGDLECIQSMKIQHIMNDYKLHI